jgi:hypothetical protein
MDEATARVQALRDDALPAMGAMLGPEAGEMLAAALQIGAGRSLEARPAQVTWQPGRSLAVRYDARIRTPGGRDHVEPVIAATGDGAPEGPVVLQRGAARVAVWRLADDPQLPGLAQVLNREGAGALLRSVGVQAGDAQPHLRAYRPGRRAVVELRAGRARLFAKVVRPERVAALQARHAQMSRALRVPRTHGWSPAHGLVLLEALGGVTLRAAFGDPRPVPEPAGIASLLERIPAPDDGAIAATPAEGVPGHIALLSRIRPERATELQAMQEALSRADGRAERLVPVHGDLHEAQVLTDRGHISGLIDIDTVAMGRRSDDWASLLGHLIVWGDTMPPAVQQRVDAFASKAMALAERECDRAGLRLRIAAVALGLATGPFRVQSNAWPAETRRRIDLAQAWIADANVPAHAPMRSSSWLPQGHLTSRTEDGVDGQAILLKGTRQWLSNAQRGQ